MWRVGDRVLIRREPWSCGRGAASSRRGEASYVAATVSAPSPTRSCCNLQVLAALGSTAEAARTTVLGRRWAGLWPELHLHVLAQAFRGVELAGGGTFRDVLAGGGARRLPNPSRLVLHVTRPDDGVVTAAEVTSLLRAAEKHGPRKLTLVVGGGNDEDRHHPFELPCFATATDVELQIRRRSFTLPPAGEFTRLERLSISLCAVDPSVFLDRCPRLRKLAMDGYWEQDAVAVRSESLEEVVIKDLPVAVAGGGAPRRVDVVAPLLKKVTLFSYGNGGLVMEFSESSSNVENLSYKYYSMVSMSSCFVGSGCWRLRGLDMAMAVEESSSGYGPVNLVPVLSLEIIALNEPYHVRVNRSFAEEIACLPVKNFSVLKLELPRLDGFVVGPLVFHLMLGTVTVIQKLQLVLSPIMTSYARRGSRIRLEQDTSFTELEEVEIHGFDVTYHSLKFLKRLFKSAPELKIMRIQLPSGVSLSHSGYKELCSVLRQKCLCAVFFEWDY